MKKIRVEVDLKEEEKLTKERKEEGKDIGKKRRRTFHIMMTKENLNRGK